MWHLRLITLGMAAVVIALTAFGGATLIGAFAGSTYRFAYSYVLLFGISAAIDLTGVGLEPLHATAGRTGRILGTRLIGAAVYALTLAILLPIEGAIAAPVASILTSLVIRIRLGFSGRAILRRTM